MNLLVTLATLGPIVVLLAAVLALPLPEDRPRRDEIDDFNAFRHSLRKASK